MSIVDILEVEQSNSDYMKENNTYTSQFFWEDKGKKYTYRQSRVEKKSVDIFKYGSGSEQTVII